MNVDLARSILEKLARSGVQEVVVCAGARNAPFVSLLEKASGVKIHSFFEERSAGFFALGLMQKLKSPVAVLTTSGTAVAELLPAVIEAHYSGLPLIVISSDRPKSYRGSGAPQAIEQAGLFGNYVEKCFDLDSNFDLALSLSWKKPLHINVCFDEPLLDKEIESWNWPIVQFEQAEVESKTIEIPFQRPVAIVSGLNADDVSGVKEFLLSSGIPVYLESTSGLREDADLQSQRISSSDKFLNLMAKKDWIDGVVRIGGVPTLRFWRDLESQWSALPVIDFSNLEFGGHGREQRRVHTLNALPLSQKFESFVEWKELDLELCQRIEALFFKYPKSELSMLRSLSRFLKSENLLYLGNSLPIREWDLASACAQPVHAFANRGANGIDGQLSTFFGMVDEKCEAWGVFGDLTTLYDLSSPWALPQESCAQIVVINNSGGQIFSRIFESSQFRNEHELGFSSWAAMWGLNYLIWNEVPEKYFAERSSVIEIVPDAQSTRAFWSEYDNLWS